jgi:hypothetical protein
MRSASARCGFIGLPQESEGVTGCVTARRGGRAIRKQRVLVIAATHSDGSLVWPRTPLTATGSPAGRTSTRAVGDVRAALAIRWGLAWVCRSVVTRLRSLSLRPDRRCTPSVRAAAGLPWARSVVTRLRACLNNYCATGLAGRTTSPGLGRGPCGSVRLLVSRLLLRRSLRVAGPGQVGGVGRIHIMNRSKRSAGGAPLCVTKSS